VPKAVRRDVGWEGRERAGGGKERGKGRGKGRGGEEIKRDGTSCRDIKECTAFIGKAWQTLGKRQGEASPNLEMRPPHPKSVFLFSWFLSFIYLFILTLSSFKLRR
jgi:hypothetical protein